MADLLCSRGSCHLWQTRHPQEGSLSKGFYYQWKLLWSAWYPSNEEQRRTRMASFTQLIQSVDEDGIFTTKVSQITGCFSFVGSLVKAEMLMQEPWLHGLSPHSGEWTSLQKWCQPDSSVTVISPQFYQNKHPQLHIVTQSRVSTTKDTLFLFRRV